MSTPSVVAKAHQSSVVTAPDMLCRMMQYLAHLHPVSESTVHTNGRHHRTMICLHEGSLLQPVAGPLCMTKQALVCCHNALHAVPKSAECCKSCAESNQQKPVIATADLGTEINGKPWMFLDRYSKLLTILIVLVKSHVVLGIACSSVCMTLLTCVMLPVISNAY